MLAVVDIAGFQYEVHPNDIVYVPLQSGEPGDKLEFNDILLFEDGENKLVGKPYLKGNVEALILEHGKDTKILVFHKKRRKGYRKLNGHRQRYSKIEIKNITV